MAAHSFFVDPGSLQGPRAVLRGQTAHQMRSVLRLRPGESVELLDGSGWVHAARILEINREQVVVEVVERRPSNAEPGVELELYQALLKGQKMEMVLQKGTEIGVSRFVPIMSERCISRPSSGDLAGRMDRWRSIVREAAEQSGRSICPTVEPLESFQDGCRGAARADLALMAWEEERSLGVTRVVAGLTEGRSSPSLPSTGPRGPGQEDERPRVALVVGPEGGFSPSEAEAASRAGLRLVSLGTRILRAETAALVATTLVLCATGDLGG